ncbi:MAG: lipoyl synthase [Phycisphaerae bacterium]
MNKKRFPSWLKTSISTSEQFNETQRQIGGIGINTICDHANCPNKGECWARGTATVLILGSNCTRNCKFCSVTNAKPEPVDVSEPDKVAELVRRMQIKYLVITSVTRDDLPDGGASHFRDVVLRSRAINPQAKFEILTPDFSGVQEEALEILSPAHPFVFSHNIETVREVFGTVRPEGDYTRSLRLLELAAGRFDTPVKSSFMLGLGESDEQVKRLLGDLLQTGVSRVSIGQYLKSNRDAVEVAEFVHPDKFAWWAEYAKSLGFSFVQSSPFTRSSYMADAADSELA